MAADTYPEVYVDAGGFVRVRCDSPGLAAVSQQVGDGGPMGALAFIGQVANVAGLEVDDSQDADGAGPITISIAAGS